MKKFITFIIALLTLIVISVPVAYAARTESSWLVSSDGTYIYPANALNVLLPAVNGYLNFGTFSGSIGYGFRDSGGIMQFKNSGGNWAAFGSGGGGGGSSGGTWSTTTSQVAGELVNYSNNSTDVVAIGSTATTTAPFYFDPNTLKSKIGTVISGIWNGTTIAVANGGTGLTATGASSTVFTTNGTTPAWQKLPLSTFTNDSAFLSSITADAPLSGAGTSASHLVISTAGTWSGNAVTASALAANGTNCSAGNYPLGVDAAGNSEGCTLANTGTVTAVSVASANGLAGSSSGGSTPTLTLSTTVTGVVKGNGTSFSAAANGTDLTLLTTTNCATTPGNVVNAVTASGGVTCGAAFSTTSADAYINASSTIPHPAGGATGNVLQWDGTKYISVATSTLGLGGSGGGSVTSVDASATGSGLSFTGGPITTSGTLNLGGILNLAHGGTGNVIFASSSLAISNGTILYPYATSSLGLQSPITLTTTGSSGAASFIANVLNIPQYSGSGTGAPYPFQGANNSTTTLTGFTNGIYATASSTIGNGTQAGGLTINGGATTTGTAYFAGRLGIGTTSPYSQLSINSNSTSDTVPSLIIDGVSGGNNADINLNRGSNTGTEEANIDFSTAGAINYQLGIQNNSTNNFELWDGSNNPIITANNSTGDVGIGTTSPYAELSVWGDSTPGDAAFSVISTASSTMFNVLNNGNVGIGTTSPYVKLSVDGRGVFNQDVRANYFTATSTTNSSIFTGGLTALASSTIGNSTGTGGLTVSGNSTTTGIANFGSKVFVGTTTDNGNGYNLNVVSNTASAVNIESPNGIPELQFQNGPTDLVGNGTLWDEYMPSGSTDLRFFNSGSDEFIMKASGDFGIGTTTFGLNTGRTLAMGSANNYLYIPTVGTSTYHTGSGINLTSGGCFAVAGVCITGGSGGSGSPYPFNVAPNATTTLVAFNGGLTSYASTTIGAGAQATGLTVNGGATTTGSVQIGLGATSSFNVNTSGLVGVGTSTQDSTLDVAGSVRFEGLSATTSPSISGAIIGLGCDSGDLTGFTGLASTTVFLTTPQSYPGDGLNWFSYALNSTTIRTKVCSDVTVTPGASTYNIRIIK